jgi:hypothetical protein
MIYPHMVTRLLVSLMALAVPLRALPAQDTAAAPVPAPAAPPAPRPPKSSSTQITGDDIDKVRASVANAYDAVKLLRPRWLRTDVLRLPGGSASGSDMQMQRIHVFMDDRDMGDLDYLRSIPAGQIFTLRFMSMAEVGARFGPSSGPGIVVTLKR